jgi:DHA2 family multidrug resistance protein
VAATAERQGAHTVPAAIWAGFAMMCVGMFMAILDVQVVATSLPTIQRALNIAQDRMSWIQTACLIAEIISIPLTGYLTQTLSMRWLFVGAAALFTLASLGCEIALPQAVRGGAIMFCILPSTQLALGHLAKTTVADASGLFNMMRNLGGAIGIAVIDTVIYTRAPEHGRALVGRLLAGDGETARTLGIPREMYGASPLDPAMQALLKPLVDKAAFVEAVNDAWALVALITFAALIVVPLARRAP